MLPQLNGSDQCVSGTALKANSPSCSKNAFPWRNKRRQGTKIRTVSAAADSLEEAGDKLFTFIRLPQSQWKSARTTIAIERLNEEFRRRIKTQTVLPTPETVPMLFWALMASGQIQMRKVDGSETLDQPLAESLDLAG